MQEVLVPPPLLEQLKGHADSIDGLNKILHETLGR
jgi:hypothetical protein